MTLRKVEYRSWCEWDGTVSMTQGERGWDKVRVLPKEASQSLQGGNG